MRKYNTSILILFGLYCGFVKTIGIYLDPLAPPGGDGSLSQPFNDIFSTFASLSDDSKYDFSSIYFKRKVILSMDVSLVLLNGPAKQIELLNYEQAYDSPSISIDFPKIIIKEGVNLNFYNMELMQTNSSTSEKLKKSPNFFLHTNASLTLQDVKFSDDSMLLRDYPLIISSGNARIEFYNVIFANCSMEYTSLIIIYGSSFYWKNTSVINMTINSYSLLFFNGSSGLIQNIFFQGNILKADIFSENLSLLHMWNTTTYLENIVFESNTLLNGEGNLGIFDHLLNIAITQLKINGNIMKRGLAIKFIDISEKLVLNNTIIINNDKISGLHLINIHNYLFENFVSSGNNEFSCYDALGCSTLLISKSTTGLILNSIFKGNCASWSPVGIMVVETALSHFLYLISTIFEENYTFYLTNEMANLLLKVKGNAIYIQSPLNLTILDCNFRRNKIQADALTLIYGSGPVMFLEDDLTNALVIGSIFLYNEGVSKSDCIDPNHITLLIIENCTFIRNGLDISYEQSSITCGVYCGSVEILWLKNVIVLENNAHSGGIFTFYSKTTTSVYKVFVENCFFFSNQGVYYGVLFFAFEEYNISISQSIFYKNKAYKGTVVAGGFVSKTFLAIFKDCQFFMNEALFEGGVGHIANIGGGYVFENCYFFNNSARKGGVFIYVATIDSPVKIKNCIFSNNYASVRGAISAISSGTIIDLSSIYFNNSARREGGIHVLENNALVEMTSVILIKSHSFYSGGVAVLMEENSILVNGGTLIIESKALFGSCFLISTMSKLNITDAIFLYNEGLRGTLVYLSNCLYLSEISEIVIFNNSAREGALFLIANSKLKAQRIKFKRNYGGIFLLMSSNAEFLNMEFLETNCGDNKAQKGCLFFLKQTSKIKVTFISVLNSRITHSSALIIAETSEIELKKGEINLAGIEFEMTTIIGDFSIITIWEISFLSIGSSMIISRESALNIFSITVEAAKAKIKASNIICLNCKSLDISDSQFSNIESLDSAGAIYLFGQTFPNVLPTCSIVKCSFNFNSGSNGGAIYIENARVQILNSEFIENKAIQNGGAIHLKNGFVNVGGITYFSIIRNCSFSNNKAILSGGAIFWEGEEPLNLLSNTFSENNAAHGLNIATDPAFLLPSADCPTILVSGRNVEKPLVFMLVDVYNQQINYLKYATATIFWNKALAQDESSEEIKVVMDEQTVEIEEGRFVFDKVKLVSTPGKENVFYVKTTALNRYYAGNYIRGPVHDPVNPIYSLVYANKIDKDKEYFLSFSVAFRSCEVGEIYITEQNICDKCPAGQYSLSIEDKICKDCPKEATCNGGSHLSVLPGYWRQNTSTLNFYQCIGDEGCIGGTNDNLCKEGYKGPLCDSCVFENQNKYFKINDFDCEICDNFSQKSMFFSFLFKIALMVFILLYFVITNIRAQKESLKSVSLKRKTYVELIHTRMENKQGNALIKLMINYLQVLSMISNLKIKWPDFISTVTSSTAFLSNYGFLTIPIDCLLQDLAADFNYPLMIIKIFLGLGLFYTFIILTCIFWFLFKKLFSKKSLKNEILSSILVPVFLFQPAIVNLLVAPLKCTVIEGKRLLSENLALSCDDDFYYKRILAVVIPNLGVWMILAPLMLLAYLRKNRRIIYTTNLYYTCDFIINGFKRKWYYWEFLHLTNKYFIIFITTFVMKNLLAALMSFLILNIFLLMEISINPYVKKNLNTISIFSQAANLINISAGLFFGTDIHPTARTYLFGFILFINALFVLLWLRNFFPFLILRIVGLFKNTKCKIFSKYCPRIFNRTRIRPENSKISKTSKIQLKNFQQKDEISFESPSLAYSK